MTLLNQSETQIALTGANPQSPDVLAKLSANDLSAVTSAVAFELARLRERFDGTGDVALTEAVAGAIAQLPGLDVNSSAAAGTMARAIAEGISEISAAADIGTGSAMIITNVTGAGTITAKAFQAGTSPASKVMTGATSDNDDITVHFEVHSGGTPWQPLTVTASGGGGSDVTSASSTWTQAVANGARVFSGTVNLPNSTTTGDITLTLSDGDVETIAYVRGLSLPLILTAAWNGTYPASQTQVKSGDTITVTGTVQTHATSIRVASFGATSSQQDFAGDYSSGTFSVSVVIGSGSGSQQFRLSATAGGGYGGTFDTTDSPAIDLDQTSPTFGAFSVNYNGTQEAAKGAETFDVTLAHTNIAAGDTYLYNDTTGTDVTIPSTTSYLSPKTGCTINTAGIYRDDTSPANFRLTVTRTTKNGRSASAIGTVQIADLAAKIKIDDSSTTYASGGSAARMGTDDGALNYGDRNLYVISDQKHLSTSTSSIVPAAGDSSAFIGSWAEDDDFTFRRNFRVQDGDIKTGGQAANTFTWITITTTNRAGTVTTTITKNPTYTIGGFAKRRLTIPAWPNREADISVLVVDTAKLTAELLSKGGAGPGGGTVQTFDNSPGQGSTPDDEVDKFCISDGADLVDDDHQFYYNKDQAAAIANTSGTAQVDIEETT